MYAVFANVIIMSTSKRPRNIIAQNERAQRYPHDDFEAPNYTCKHIINVKCIYRFIVSRINARNVALYNIIRFIREQKKKKK